MNAELLKKCTRRAWGEYNCMGYAFGIEEWLVVEDLTQYDHYEEIAEKFKSLDDVVDDRANFILEIFDEYKVVDEATMLALPVEVPVIAFAVGHYDFHFMKRILGEWFEKMGGQSIKKNTHKPIPKFTDEYKSKRVYFIPANI